MNHSTSASLPTSSNLLTELRDRVDREFQAQFSRPATVIAAAPGRVNLIGEHIDYNDGFVLPMAIERYVVIAAAPAADASRPSATVYSTNLHETADIPLGNSQAATLDNWGRYLEGVVAGFAEQGIPVPPFDAVIGSNVPHGGGLSSSAALEVATATLVESLTDHTLEPLQKALLCQQAEHRFAGVPCGIMDQFSSVFGQPDHLMLIDCRSQQYDTVPFDADGISVLITNSNVKHELSGGEYAARRNECDQALRKLNQKTWRNVSLEDVLNAGSSLSDIELRRARHVVTEIARTIQAAEAFRDSDWDAVGQLMYASHESLRDDFEVSCRELDQLVEIAIELGTESGVLGSRMTGGGFGGCTVSLVRDHALPEVIQSLTSRYQSATGVTPSCFSSRPALGAHLIQP